MKSYWKLSAIVSALLLAFGPALASAYVIHGDTPGKWGSETDGTGANVSWSIMGAKLTTDNSHSTKNPDSILPTNYLTAFEGAFSAWAAVADLTFTQQKDPNVGWKADNGSDVDIRIGFRTSNETGNLGYSYYPMKTNGSGAGDIFLNASADWFVGTGAGKTGEYNLEWTLVHEIGHAIGLGHTDGDEGASHTMSHIYNAAWTQPDDDAIAGIQHLYGAPQAITASVPAPDTSLLLLLVGLGLLGLTIPRRRVARD